MSDQTTLTLHLPDDILIAIDQHIRSAEATMTREAAVVYALREWATMQGYLSNSAEGLRPDQLSAANDD